MSRVQSAPPPANHQQGLPPQSEALLDQVIQATKDREAEFVPFGAKEKIKLTVPIVLKYLCTPTRSGKVCDERQAVKFIMLCKARLLNPFEGDAYIVGYDSQDGPSFSLITAHQAFLKRAEVHQEYDGMESGVIVQVGDEIVNREGDILYRGDTILGGWATVHFKNRKYPMKKRLKLDTFNTGQSRWKKDAAGMIVKCAEADALRSAFPTSLGGMYLEDELASVVPADDKPKEAPKAAPIGRVKLHKNGNGTHAAAPSSPSQTPELPPAPHVEEEHQPDAEAAPAEENSAAEADVLPLAAEAGDQQGLSDFISDMTNDLPAARTMEDLQALGAQLMKQQTWLGEAHYKTLLALYQARYKVLSPSPAPPAEAKKATAKK